MRIGLQTIADTVVAHAEGKARAEIDAMMRDLVAWLASRGMLGKWRALTRAIDRAWARRYGAANVTVVSAHPLSEAAREAVAAAAKGADVREVVDARLIGGAIVRVDNTRIDGSVTGSLMRLKNKMYTEV